MSTPAISARRCADLTEDEISGLHGLFHANYRDGDEAYLGRSRETFRFVALAYDDQATMVGFAFGDTRETSIPELGGLQVVAMAGIACIDPELRRQGLFQKLASAAMQEAGVEPSERVLFAGRMAHVVTYRTLRNLSPSTVVPDVSRTATARQRAVGQSVAALFGSTIDPLTFVAKGSGRPIGFPRLDYEITAAEAALFEPVNRDHGDALLAMCWIPTPPVDW